MFKVKRVEIDGFWGKFSLRTDLNKDVNIFIGKNGTGKTTLINFLESAMTADIDLMEALQFQEIRLFLRDLKQTKKVTISRVFQKSNYDKLVFKIGNHVIDLPLFPKEIEFRRRRFHPKYIEALNEINETMKKLINVSWISVHREILEDEYRDPETRKTSTEKYPIDKRIGNLTKRFTEYQLELQSEINSISDNFKKDVLASILYNENFDTVKHLPDRQLDLTVKEILISTYKDLGILDNEVSLKIEEHIERINKSIVAIKHWQKEKKGIHVDDVLPISLWKRTQHIIDLSTTLEQKKKEINGPVDLYLNTLKSYIEDKEFRLNPNLRGQLIVAKGSTDLPLDQLSSGEKQLFILLTEALLQRHEPSVFIADEPELSLHIKWQKQIISSINTLNNNAQVIVATHSPEIASGRRDKLIRMEQIIYD